MPITVPNRGDFITLSFDPAKGHEQQGHRPALVISPKAYNKKTGLCYACPITNTARSGNPFRVPIPPTVKLTGYIMVDQVRAIDYQARHAKVLSSAPNDLTDDALAILDAILFSQ